VTRSVLGTTELCGKGSVQRVLCNVEATWYRELLFLGALMSRVSAKRKERETENKRDIGALFRLLRRENFSPEWRRGNAVLKGKTHGRILGVVLS